ncbi:spermatogenesis-defective protein 39 homolog [Trichonephila clavipes]|nr:spermatogenesis-defective protein 39 homolog [Trichonephila clavipes]
MTATSISELTSDHNPVNFDISLNNFTSPPLSTFTFPNWHKFQTVLSESIPGNPTISNKDEIDQTVTNFNNSIQDAIRATSTYKAIHHPITTIPRQLRENIKYKNRLRKEWQQTKYPPLKTQINKLQREIKTAINNFKNSTWNNILEQATPEDYSLYSLIKNKKNKLNQMPPIVCPQGLAYDPEAKAKVFVKSLEDSFTDNPEPFDNDFIEEVNIETNNYLANGIDTVPPLTTPGEIMNIILKLDNRKAPGPDSIKNIALKALPLNAITNLTKTINKCLIYKYFPIAWKTANITVLPRIWHKGLIYKLIKRNFPPYLIHIINSFLNNRTFRVKIDHFISQNGSLKSGCPQGSLLSPILFNIFTSDFPTHPEASIHLFADDAAILVTEKTESEVRSGLQSYLHILQKWLTKWRIAINTNKSQAIMFRCVTPSIPNDPLLLFNRTIAWTTKVKYLGLTLDHNLRYKSHLHELKTNYWKNTHFQSGSVNQFLRESVVEHKICFEHQIVLEDHKISSDENNSTTAKLFEELTGKKELYDSSILCNLIFSLLYFYNVPKIASISPTSVKARYNFSPKQYTWCALRVLAALKKWADIEELFSSKNWLSGVKMRSCIGFVKVLDVLVKRRAPPEVIYKYISCLEDQSLKLPFAKKYKCHTYVIEALQKNKDRLGLLEYRNSLPPHSVDYSIATNILNNVNIKWKN